MHHMENVHIRGIHSHENTELQFSDGVNVIIGDSDAGKSAIMRTLWWARFNRPGGDILARTGAKEQSVALSAGPNQLTRGRTKTKNWYKLTTPDGETVFDKVGTDVPEAVVQCFPLQTLNFLRQRDPIFFLTQSPGERVRFLNDQVSDLWMIDRFTTDFNRDLRSEEKTEKEHKELAEEAEANAEVLSWVPQVQERIENALAKHKAWENECQRMQRANEHLQTAKKIEDSLPDRTKLKELADSVKDIEDRYLKLEQEQIKLGETRETLQQIGEYARRLKRMPRLTKALKDKLNTLIQKAEALEKTRQDCKKAKDAFATADACHAKLQKISGQAEELRTELKEKFPDICPLCGADWSE